MAIASPPRTAAPEELSEVLQAMLAALRRLRGREGKQREGLSFAQWRLLRPLATGGELSAAQLAAAAELTPATVTPMLDQLVLAGLVERARSNVDRRVVRNRLTPAGEAAFGEKAAELQQKWELALADLSAEELAAGAAVLGRLRDYFEKL
jgi:DNA-binding MarR family transcriptional regulator